MSKSWGKYTLQTAPPPSAMLSHFPPLHFLWYPRAIFRSPLNDISSAFDAALLKFAYESMASINATRTKDPRIQFKSTEALLGL